MRIINYKYLILLLRALSTVSTFLQSVSNSITDSSLFNSLFLGLNLWGGRDRLRHMELNIILYSQIVSQTWIFRSVIVLVLICHGSFLFCSVCPKLSLIEFILLPLFIDVIILLNLLLFLELIRDHFTFVFGGVAAAATRLAGWQA